MTYVHPTYLDTVDNVTWHDDVTLWATAVNSPLDNIWYFGSRVSPIYKACRLNASDALPFTLPPLRAQDILYMPGPGSLVTEQSREWSQAFLEVSTGLRSPRVETPSTQWTKSLSPRSVQCFKRAVMTGAFGQVVRALTATQPAS
jgi:hypothetical protein